MGLVRICAIAFVGKRSPSCRKPKPAGEGAAEQCNFTSQKTCTGDQFIRPSRDANLHAPRKRQKKKHEPPHPASKLSQYNLLRWTLLDLDRETNKACCLHLIQFGHRCRDWTGTIATIIPGHPLKFLCLYMHICNCSERVCPCL